MTDLLVFATVVVVAAVAGIGLGMLVAARVGRHVDPDPLDEEDRDHTDG